MLSAVPIPEGISAFKVDATIDDAVIIPEAFILLISNPAECRF